MVKLDYARLKNIRLEQDITQKELATATGVNLSTIKQIETGRSATDLENIEKLCAYLEVDINEIYHPDFHDTKVLCMLNNKAGEALSRCLQQRLPGAEYPCSSGAACPGAGAYPPRPGQRPGHRDTGHFCRTAAAQNRRSGT